MEHGKTLKELISEKKIQSRVKMLGRDIAEAYEEKEVIAIGILKGSFIFMADLLRAIPSNNIQVDFLGVKSYGDEMTSSGEIIVSQDLSTSVKDKNIILIEDIVDTGLTVSFLIERFLKNDAASVKVCSLLSKPSLRKIEVPIDFLGFTIPNVFVVGYGLDYKQKMRNLPYVGYLN